jgi:GT2 family glycosyltransferase
MVVICTRHRAGELATAITAVANDRPSATVVVVDASEDGATKEVCENLDLSHPGLRLHYLGASRPGLARQRNEGIEFCRRLGAEVVHFIDDDTEVLPGYFEALESRLRENPHLGGVGAVIDNQPEVHHRWLRMIFLLWGPRPNSVLRSGRPVLGQFPNGRHDARVDWLSGCAMSYRVSVFAENEFDNRLSGYSHGEDYDFGFRVSRGHPLAVEPESHCLHHRSARNRVDTRRLAYVGTVSGYVWAREQRRSGISVLAYWWSVFGELLLHSSYGLWKRDRSELLRCRGVVGGVRAILAGRASRDPVLPA